QKSPSEDPLQAIGCARGCSPDFARPHPRGSKRPRHSARRSSSLSLTGATPRCCCQGTIGRSSTDPRLRCWKRSPACRSMPANSATPAPSAAPRLMNAERGRTAAIRVRALAKINLTLRVLGVRPDGFHELRTTYQSLALHDDLTLTLRPGPLEIESDDPRCP